MKLLLMTKQRKLVRRMKNNGFIFKIRCINFVSKLNLYQLEVLLTITRDKIADLKKKGLIKQELNGKKVKK